MTWGCQEQNKKCIILYILYIILIETISIRPPFRSIRKVFERVSRGIREGRYCIYVSPSRFARWIIHYVLVLYLVFLVQNVFF